MSQGARRLLSSLTKLFGRTNERISCLEGREEACNETVFYTMLDRTFNASSQLPFEEYEGLGKQGREGGV